LKNNFQEQKMLNENKYNEYLYKTASSMRVGLAEALVVRLQSNLT
jgi:hypothetical protein